MTLILNPDIIYRVTSFSELYDKASFLTPIKNIALDIHKKANSVRCTNCTRKALERAKNSLAAAFVKLLVDESAKTPNQLNELKAQMNQILGANHDQISVYYVKLGMGKTELKF